MYLIFINTKSKSWLEIQDNSRWISSKIHMDGKINLCSGISAAEGELHAVRKKTVPWSFLSASLTQALVVMVPFFFPCTDIINFTMRFLTACHVPVLFPPLFQITKYRSRWVFGKSPLMMLYIKIYISAFQKYQKYYEQIA